MMYVSQISKLYALYSDSCQLYLNKIWREKLIIK